MLNAKCWLEIKRSQHYDWLIPVYYKNPEREDTEVKVLYLEARTVTVKRTLVPNVEVLEFGEIPVAFRKVWLIMISNTYYIDLRNLTEECWLQR